VPVLSGIKTKTTGHASTRGRSQNKNWPLNFDQQARPCVSIEFKGNHLVFHKTRLLSKYSSRFESLSQAAPGCQGKYPQIVEKVTICVIGSWKEKAR
jgi:hypothetical protein